MLRRVTLVSTDVSEEVIAFILRVTRIRVLGIGVHSSLMRINEELPSDYWFTQTLREIITRNRNI
jgi:hypothetical protein